MLLLTVNGKPYRLDVPVDTPLLRVLRDDLGLTGTRNGGGEALCGACTVKVDGMPVCACTTPVSSVVGKQVETVDGLALDREHPAPMAWRVEDSSQHGCGIPGGSIPVSTLSVDMPKSAEADMDRATSGTIRRGGTSLRISRAIHRAADILAAGGRK